jgi:3-phytase
LRDWPPTRGRFGALTPLEAGLGGLSGILLIAFIGLLIAVCSRSTESAPDSRAATATPNSTVVAGAVAVATAVTSTPVELPTATAVVVRATGATATAVTATATTEAPTPVPPTATPPPAAVVPASVDRVTATVETDPVPGRDDAADDPAIWVHPLDPALSVVIGTDKDNGGLGVYNLDGSQLQYLNTGEVNNVDLRYDFPLGNDRVALLIASDRTNNTIAVFRMNPDTRQLSAVAARNNRSNIDVYGACMYHSAKTGAYYAFVTEDGDGAVEQWEIKPEGEGVTMNRVRVLNHSDQTEGCVADDLTGVLYVAEEDAGIWRYGAEPDAGTARQLIDATKGGHLRADVEGLAIYYAGATEGYLIASSQGNDSYVIYDRAGNAYVGTFKIVDGAVDGVQETDGLDVTNQALGPLFPNGLFVVQDGSNRDASGREGHQNFKLVPWETIAGFIQPPLQINTRAR